MSSYIQNDLTYSAMYKSIKQWLQLNKRDYFSHICYWMRRYGMSDADEEVGFEDMKPSQLAEVIIRHMVEAQVACVTCQYGHGEFPSDVFKSINAETDDLLSRVFNMQRTPTYKDVGISKLFSSYLYQCETHHFHEFTDSTSEQRVEQWQNTVKFIEWLDYFLLRQVRDRMPEAKSVPWEIHEEDLHEEGHKDPISLTELMGG